MKDYFEQLKIIKELYKDWKPRNDPYIYDWMNFFTPIERNVWNDIRFLGLPFYPQFPVGNYFIDFADPVQKIGIEVDGKIHNERQEKDKIREENLKKLGWKILRIKGRNTYEKEDEENEEDEENYDEEKDYNKEYDFDPFNRYFYNDFNSLIILKALKKTYYGN